MANQIHILNGDSLKKILPEVIKGEQIVMRECLAQGPVDETDLDLFYKSRASFIKNGYKISGDIDYNGYVVSELDKIADVNSNSEINLWFEYDVFCQVNSWFILNFIFQKKLQNSVYLVSPLAHSPYMFSGLSSNELELAFEQKAKVENLSKMSLLWTYYQESNFDELLNIAQQLKYKFLIDAVKAIIATIPTLKSKGILIETLIQIKRKLQTNEFNLIFKEFSNRLPIYGYGDLQVKYLLSKIEE